MFHRGRLTCGKKVKRVTIWSDPKLGWTISAYDRKNREVTTVVNQWIRVGEARHYAFERWPWARIQVLDLHKV